MTEHRTAIGLPGLSIVGDHTRRQGMWFESMLALARGPRGNHWHLEMCAIGAIHQVAFRHTVSF